MNEQRRDRISQSDQPLTENVLRPALYRDLRALNHDDVAVNMAHEQVKTFIAELKQDLHRQIDASIQSLAGFSWSRLQIASSMMNGNMYNTV